MCIRDRVGVDDILGRHVAIMGTTGVGKSCAVGLVVSRVIEAEPNLRVVMLDPHDEFASASVSYTHLDVYQRQDLNITISVIDNGIGINGEDIPRLAKPFEQVENEHSRLNQGTGLGPVSYTHLDVYKRQLLMLLQLLAQMVR